MKTKLFTRNTTLGLLISLVLALGVQGNPANALTLRITSGDLVTVAPDQEFTLRFSVVGLKSPQPVEPNTRRGNATDIEYADGTRTRSGDPANITSNFTVIVDTGYTAGDTHYYVVTTTEDVNRTSPLTGTVVKTTNTRNWVTESAAYYNNDESVSITSTPTLMKGNTAVTSLVERHAERDQQLSSSITLTGSHSTAGAFDIVITDTTVAGDIDGTPPDPRASITFTVFVAERNPAAAVAEWGFIGLQTVTEEEYKVGGDDFADDAITNASTAAHVKVDYSVIEGSGRLYVQRGTAPIRKTSAARTITTSSAAEVRLDMNGTTNKVRAEISGVAPVTATFIFGNPKVAIVSGNGQDGVFGGQLDDPLVVKVTDGRGRALSGLAADFATTATAAMFIPVPGTTVYTTDAAGGTLAAGFTAFTREAKSARPPPAGDIVVQTDSRGEARTYFQLGTTTTETSQTVTVSAGGANLIVPPNFRFDAESGAGRPTLSILSGNNQTTDSNGDLDDPLVVVVRQDGRLKPNELVTFHTSKGTLIGRNLADNGDLTSKRVYGMTNGRGQAEVQYFQDRGEGSDTVTATISGTDPAYEREIVFGVNGGQSTRAPTPPAAPATNTITITLSSTTGAPGDEIDVEVDSSPQGVLVNIDSGDLSDADFSRLSGGTPFTSRLTLPDEADRYTFSATRAGFTSDSATVTVAAAGATGARLEIAVSGTGTTRTVTVTALNAQGGEVPGLDVTLSGSALIGGARTVRVDTPTPITVRTGTLQAAATGFTSATESITVTGGGTGTTPPATSTGGTLTLTAVSAVVNGSQTVEVTARSAAGTAVGGLTVSLSGAGFTTRTVTTLSTGSVRAIVALPDTTGSHLLYATATGYTAGSVILTATGQTATTPTTATPTTAGDPSRISISGLSTHTGTVNEALDTSLSVRVLDANGIGVEDARVIFRVRTGQGRLSDRGNGRAIAVATDSNGSARASYTPLSASSTVSASVTGVSEGVTFTITADGAPATTTPTPGTPTTSTPTVSPVVNTGVAADSRPPMLWISGGKIYGLVGSEVKEFIAGVENATHLAIAGGKVYWTEQTSETRGTLNSANLDGTGAKELKDLWGVPRGIAVDTAGSHLYWVDAANRLQRSNLDGSGIQNVLRNLSDPIDLALANGNAYWTQGNGSVRFVNLTGTKNLRNISTGMDAAGSIAIAGGKVYWTEQIDGTYGTLNSANLDGTDAKELRDDPLWGAPVGIAVDTARSRLYWTDAAGRLQRSNLDGSGIHNVAKGLGSPGDLVLSNSITAPTGTPSTTTTTTSTTASKYDVNGDGTVDSKDVDAILVALAAGSTDTKYDVDGDGTVNIFDLIDLRGQIQGAAAAPTLLGMKFTAVQVEHLQEQIDLLVASGDRSPAALKTLIYLQQLIATARPEKTQLLANYPNPFNPETWIPYELATDTDVKITIYNAQGVVIRTLQLGQQSAGYYTDRERAAYWDGKNALGEQVASGIYFYQLETDDMSSLRKMVILK